MITIATVLQTINLSGKGEYGPQHVLWVKKQIDQWVKCPHRFVCLTSVEVPGVDCIRLQFDWPGWYSKLELFTLIATPAFYLDLDTVITGDITHMLEYPHTFTTTRFMFGDNPCVNSSVMAWSMDLSALTRKFKTNPDGYISRHVVADSWVDQGFIQEQHPPHQYFQDIWPGQVMSFKNDLKQQDPSPDCRIVMFHGKPKPQDVNRPWIPSGL